MALPPIANISKWDILKGFRTDFLNFLNRLFEQYGDTFMLEFPFRQVVTRDPKILKHILHDNYLNYPKKLDHIPVFKEIFSITNNTNSLLFTPDFDFWKKNRQTATPSFLPSKLASYTPKFVEYTEEAALVVGRAADNKVPLNVKELLGSLTLKNMLYNLFEDSDVNFTEFHYQMKEMLHQLYIKGNSYFGLRWLLPTKDRKLRKECYSYVKGTALRIIHEREASDKEHNDLLAALMQFYKETFKGQEALDSLEGDFLVYLIAGHDTTASTLNALLMYLSLYPEVEKRILEEIDAVVAEQKIDYEIANKLVYTKMAFMEALRLQSPIASFSRTSVEEDEVAGFTIPAKTSCIVSYRWANRNPLYWDNPEAFIPERFKEKRWGQDEQYAFLPFGGGPRVCIGMNFAILEAMVALAVLLPKYRFTLISGRERNAFMDATTWPGGAEEMMVQRR